MAAAPDPYRVLGVESDASLTEVKSAFRRLAKLHHPDIAPGSPEQAARFATIRAAYEDLLDRFEKGAPSEASQPQAAAARAAEQPRSTPQKEPKGDQGAKQSGSTASSGPAASQKPKQTKSPTGTRAGQEPSQTASSAKASQKDQAQGSAQKPPPSAGQKPPQDEKPGFARLFGRLTTALGDSPAPGKTQDKTPGKTAGKTPVKTKSPERAARILDPAKELFSRITQSGQDNRPLTIDLSFEDAALGTTKRVRLPGGKLVRVTLPPNLSDGQWLETRAVPVDNAGKPLEEQNDRSLLTFRVSVRGHPLLRREGAHSLLDLPLSVPEAMRGARIRIPTLEGSVVLKIHPGANSGQELRLKNRGFRSEDGLERGDQLVRLLVVLPAANHPLFTQPVTDWAKISNYAVRHAPWPSSQRGHTQAAAQ